VPKEGPQVVDPEVIAFLQGRRVAVSIASRNADRMPSVTRAVGYRTGGGERPMAVFVVARQAERLLDDVRTSRLAAVVFTQPSTHKSLQVKGGNAVVTPLEEGDWPRVAAYGDDFVAELIPLGYAESLLRKLVECTPQQVVAVRFAPQAAFGQTPGPRAGAALAEHRP
jgi:hypothetical protein